MNITYTSSISNNQITDFWDWKCIENEKYDRQIITRCLEDWFVNGVDNVNITETPLKCHVDLEVSCTVPNGTIYDFTIEIKKQNKLYYTSGEESVVLKKNKYINAIKISGTRDLYYVVIHYNKAFLFDINRIDLNSLHTEFGFVKKQQMNPNSDIIKEEFYHIPLRLAKKVSDINGYYK